MSYSVNQLDKFSIYNYRIKMTQINPIVLDSNLAEVTRKGITIIDSAGIPEFSVDSLEQIYVLGHGLIRSAVGNRFDFTISEPDGATLFDTMIQSARSMGISNHLQALYIIEISFPGRDENNVMSSLPTVFRYPVQITDATVTIDSGGAKYTLSTVEVSSSAYSYLAGVAKRTVTFQGETVGEVIADLEKRLNESELAAWYTDESSVIAPNTYKFEFDSSTQDWKNWRIEQTIAGLGSKNISLVGDKVQFTIANGSNLHEIIGGILRTTSEYKRVPTHDGGFAKPTGHEPSNTTADKLRTFYKLIADIDYKQFDPLKNDYVKTITYKIKEHIVPSLIVDATEYNKTMRDTVSQRTMVKNLFNSGLMRKRYDYLFTGKNTEVLNLDLKLTYAYFLIAPNHGGSIDQTRLTPNLGSNPDDLRSRVKSNKAELKRLNSQLSDNSGPGISVRDAQAAIAKQTGIIATLNELRLEGIDMPIRIEQATVDNRYYQSPESDTIESSNLQHATIVANLESSADLMKIELEIRGDPYWMGTPSSFYLPNQVGNDSDNVADYERGGQCFFLNIQLPIKENTQGRRIPRSDYALSGVYQVVNVIGKFQAGTFIQYLSAVRVNTINTSSVYPELDKGPGNSGNTALAVDTIPDYTAWGNAMNNIDLGGE